MMSVWETERKEIATWLSGYLAMINIRFIGYWLF